MAYPVSVLFAIIISRALALCWIPIYLNIKNNDNLFWLPLKLEVDT